MTWALQVPSTWFLWPQASPSNAFTVSLSSLTASSAPLFLDSGVKQFPVKKVDLGLLFSFGWAVDGGVMRDGLEKHLQPRIVLEGLATSAVGVPVVLAIHDFPSAVQAKAWPDQFQIQGMCFLPSTRALMQLLSARSDRLMLAPSSDLSVL
ncbi:hypothetical protein QQP08_009264 [Theobroma cacao]|nr:hypothetical protein QQP08_009264 [Theobroma cacao]